MIITTLTKDQTATKINLSKSPGTKGVSGNTSTHTKSPTGTRRFISKNPGGTIISLSKNDLQEYPVTTAQFPELIEGFTAAGISGGTLTGVLGKITATDATGWTQPSTGRFRAVSATQTTAGTWTAIGTKYALAIDTGSFAASTDNTRLGVTTGSGSYIINRISAGAVALEAGATFISSSTNITGPTAPFKSKAVLLDKSSATGWGFKYVIDSTNTGYIVPLTTLAGDMSASLPAFDSGASGAVFTNNANSYYEGAWLFAFTGRPSNELIFTAMQWMSDHPGFAYPGFTSATSAGSTLGYNSIFTQQELSGPGYIVCNKFTLASDKRAVSVQYYVDSLTTTVNMRIAIYDNTGATGLPGNLLAKTQSFTLNVGWNNMSLISPVNLPASDYWLAFQLQDGSTGRSEVSGGTRCYKAQTYGEFPSIYPASPATDATKHSIYALLV